MEATNKDKLQYLNALKIFSGEVEHAHNDLSLIKLSKYLGLKYVSLFTRAATSVGVLIKQGVSVRSTFNESYRNKLNMFTVSMITTEMECIHQTRKKHANQNKLTDMPKCKSKQMKKEITMTINLDEGTTVYTLPSQIDFKDKAQYINALGGIVENLSNFKKIIDGNKEKYLND